MGTWNAKINGNDTFQDIYQNFFELYNQGQNPVEISKLIQENFAVMFNDYDDKINSLFGLALAQWETKSLDSTVFKQVKGIIESGKDIELWKELGADDKMLKKRKITLIKFLELLSSEKEKPKRRAKLKVQFSYKELFNITSPDKKYTLKIEEHFQDGVYCLTSAVLHSENMVAGMFHYEQQNISISATWLDNTTLEIRHDKNLSFHPLKNDTFDGGRRKIVFIEK